MVKPRTSEMPFQELTRAANDQKRLFSVYLLLLCRFYSLEVTV